jgi:hypothetical protein
MTESSKPPLGLEEALALVLGCAGSFSNVPNQREFFKTSWSVYWTNMMESHKDDPVATACLQSLIPVIVSTLRAIGVQHTRFYDREKAFANSVKIEIEAANQIAQYSPLSSSKWFGKGIAMIGGGGAGGLLTQLLTTWAKQKSATIPLTIGGTLVGLLLGLFIVDYLLQCISRRKLKRITSMRGTQSQENWRANNKEELRRIAKQFLINALRVIEGHYPDVAYAGQKDMSSILAGIDPATGAPPSEAIKEKCNSYLEQVLSRHLLIK